MALLMVMCVIFALSVIVAAFAYSMTIEMRLAQITDYDVELEWMGRSGVELAEYALANKCPDQRDIDALNQFWAGGTAPCSNDIPQFSLKDYPLGNGKISVTITDMERKFDINLVASPSRPQSDVLQRALTECGVTDPSTSDKIMYSILDWISPDNNPHAGGAKSDYYSRLGPPYNCPKSPIEDISELLLIQGVTPDIYWGPNSTNHIPAAYQQKGFDHTPHSSKSRFQNEANNVPNPAGLVELFSPFGKLLNINTASAKTLQLIPGIDANTAQRIIEMRAGPDGVDGTEDDVPFHSVQELNSILPGGLPPSVAPTGAPPSQVPPPGGLSAYCDVRGYVFEVHVEAEINGVKRKFIGIVGRNPQNAGKFDCTRFYPDE